MGATALPFSVKPCSSETLLNLEDTGFSKTPKLWQPEFSWDVPPVKLGANDSRHTTFDSRPKRFPDV